jgi:hypothetical protein
MDSNKSQKVEPEKKIKVVSDKSVSQTKILEDRYFFIQNIFISNHETKNFSPLQLESKKPKKWYWKSAKISFSTDEIFLKIYNIFCVNGY